MTDLLTAPERINQELLVISRRDALRPVEPGHTLTPEQIRDRIIVDGQRICANVVVNIETLMAAPGYEAAEAVIIRALLGEIAAVPGTLLFDTTGKTSAWWGCGFFLQVQVAPEAVAASFTDLGITGLDTPFRYLDSDTGRHYDTRHTFAGRVLPHPNPEHPSYRLDHP